MSKRLTQQTDGLDVLVSGGSMGGLFTGIALADAGHDVTIYEQSTAELRSRGGGIVAQRNIREFLEDRDVVDPAEITTRSSERRFLSRDGDVERSAPDSMVFTSWDAVYRQLRDAFPAEQYRTGVEVVDVAPATATAEFADGTERTADLVVAAEGGQSSTRQQLFPGVTPQIADYAAWRGLVPETALPAEVVSEFDGTFTFYQGSTFLILAYLIPGPDGGVAPGERRLNWVWYDGLQQRDRPAIFTDVDGVERQFSIPPGGLREPVRDRQVDRAGEVLPSVFTTVVETTPDPFVQAIYDLSVPQMSVANACLLGDAAFVARPHTAAGTAKAAGDAVELAAALDRHDEVDAALSVWDESRAEYGSRLVAQGKRMGDDRLGLAP